MSELPSFLQQTGPAAARELAEKLEDCMLHLEVVIRIDRKRYTVANVDEKPGVVELVLEETP